MTESPEGNSGLVTAGPAGGRLAALDAVRGFAMFWILGVEEMGVALGRASEDAVSAFLAHQLEHAPWEGFRFLDLVFPLFLFVSGVSLVFSLSKAVEAGGRPAALRKAAIRALVLYGLGIFCYGGISGGLDGVRWLGVLQRIALCGLAGAVAFCFLRVRGLAVLTGVLLAGYWALMALVPVPGAGAGDFAEGRNLANWIDARFLPGFKWDGDHDPEGLLSTLPAIATTLLGILTGIFVRGSGGEYLRTGVRLVAAGAVMAVLGWLWHPVFPVIKKLWTSSYVLVAGGYSLVVLGVAILAVECAGWRRMAAPFIWIGMNPIALYLSHVIVPYPKIAGWIAGGPVAAAFGTWGEVWIYAVVAGLSILFAWFLYRRRIFLRV